MYQCLTGWSCRGKTQRLTNGIDSLRKLRDAHLAALATPTNMNIPRKDASLEKDISRPKARSQGTVVMAILWSKPTVRNSRTHSFSHTHHTEPSVTPNTRKNTKDISTTFNRTYTKQPNTAPRNYTQLHTAKATVPITATATATAHINPTSNQPIQPTTTQQQCPT